MERVYAERLVNDGQLRIKTASDYRDPSRNSYPVLDPQEGRHRLETTEADLVYERPVQFAGFEAFDPHTMVNRETGAIWASNVFVDRGAEAQRILSLSESGMPEVGRRMDPRYDTVVEIRSVVGFFIRVARRLVELGLTVNPYLGRCVYDGSTQWVDPLSDRRVKRIPRVLTKDSSYDWQREVRLVFPAGTRSSLPSAVHMVGCAFDVGPWAEEVKLIDVVVPDCRPYVRILESSKGTETSPQR